MTEHMNEGLKMRRVVCLMLLMCMDAAVWAQLTPGGSSSQAYVIVCNPDADINSELLLRCNTSTVIRILHHQFGYQEVALDSGTCVYQERGQDTCAWSSEEFHENIKQACMGRNQCRLLAQNPKLPGCLSKASDYLQVDYECVPDNFKDTNNIVDICGNQMNGLPISRTEGYIKSPVYPELYGPDISCSCNLSTSIPNAHIVLDVLDINLASAHSGKCGADWLEYLVDGQWWSTGTKLCGTAPANGSNTGSSNIQLNFRSDDHLESRGFWLKYRGVTATGVSSTVKVSCGTIRPIILKNASLCLPTEEESEIFMDCKHIGVIDIITAQHSIRPVVDGECSVPRDVQNVCATEPANKQAMLRSCMGEASCTVDVIMVPLPTCGGESNYFHVNYQCIPSAFEPNYIIDICGDSMTTPYIHRRHGYIESPNYPADYPPSEACYCRLSTFPDSTIRIKLLDIQLTPEGAGVCGRDWLEFRQPHQAWDTGRKLCDETLGQWIHTETNEVYIDFFVDSEKEDRGFWLEYSAWHHDGTEQPVSISCGDFSPPPAVPTVSDGNPKESANPDEAQGNLGLVAGLSALAVLMILVLAIMAFYKFRRNKKDILPPVPESVEASPLDKSYNTLKKYSSLASSRIQGEKQYSTLSSDSRQSSMRSNDTSLPAGSNRHSPGSNRNSAGSNRNSGGSNRNSAGSNRNSAGSTYMEQDLGTITGGNLPASYMNPAFENSLEGCHPMNPTV